MDRALVVVSDTDAHRELLREAGTLAAGVDAELVLLSMLTEEEYAEDVETMEAISSVEGTSYSTNTVLEAARNFATRTASEQLGDVDVSFTTVGRVVEKDERADAIVQEAEDRDCDHVFLPGRRRSPTGKAIFGDTAQSVILNFDGRVTIQLE